MRNRMRFFLLDLFTLLLALISCSLGFSVKSTTTQSSIETRLSESGNTEHTMSQFDNNPVDNSALSASTDGGGKDIPLLNPGDPNDESIRSIKLGETIRFEEMGPVIINTDGTTRRIANWDQLTKGEQEATWRRISKRNEERRKVLLDAQREDNMNENNEEKDEL